MTTERHPGPGSLSPAVEPAPPPGGLAYETIEDLADALHKVLQGSPERVFLFGEDTWSGLVIRADPSFSPPGLRPALP